MTKTVIEVKKNINENNATLLRRFSRKVMDSGIIPRVKGNRYSSRKTSKLSLKQMALRRMSRRKEMDKLKKLGKIKEREERGMKK